MSALATQLMFGARTSAIKGLATLERRHRNRAHLPQMAALGPAMRVCEFAKAATRCMEVRTSTIV